MSEQSKVAPEVASHREEQEQQQQDTSEQRQRPELEGNEPSRERGALARHLSTPACFKPAPLVRSLHLDNEPHQRRPQLDHQRGPSPEKETPLHLKGRLNSTSSNHDHKDNNNNNLDRLHRHRHSHCERRTCIERPSVNGGGGNKSSASPSSSSASDSAFSQSQTTLESESSDQSTNCFRRSLKDTSSDRFSAAKVSCTNSSHSSNRPFYGVAGGQQPAADCPLDSEDEPSSQFKIVWRNLSYRVPDKKFARARAHFRRFKEAVWPAGDSGQDHAEPAVDVEPLPSTGSGSRNESLDGEPPMRPPTTGKPRKVIFSDLHGCVKSGQLTAILGPSGAGKTTFLKCLTNSIVKGVSGSIDILGGETATSHHLKLCIIPQKDYLFDNLTVMENLVFASRIKNTSPQFNHMQNVERVANLLGLQACLKLKTNKLSGGQYKRVSIAQELLSKPDILILDEPTSGLDSLTCFRTVSVLRDLVNLSRAGLMPPLAIIMTIHQPQIKIFNLFHHVYILSSMGQCVYEGRPEYLIDTVADCCKLLPPPDDLNPASFIIDLASEVYGNAPIDQLVKLQRENANLLYHKALTPQIGSDKTSGNHLSHIELFVDPHPSTLCKGTSEITNKIGGKNGLVELNEKVFQSPSSHEHFTELKISDRLKKRNNHERNFWLHTRLLVRRLWISMWRDPLLTTTRITFHLIIPFVFYFIYSQKSGAANACPHVEREVDFQTMTSDANIRRLEIQHNELILTFENVSLFFLLLYSFSMCVLAVTALSFPLNMQILLKETSNGWYSMPRFVMAKTLADLPIELTMPMVSVSIAYLLTGQPSSYLCWRMLTVTAVMTLCSLISQTQGLLFGAYFMNNVQAAVFVSQASSLPWIMLSGFTTRVSELPIVLQWLSFGSIYRLGIESIVSVRYGFGMCPCDRELVNDTPVKMVGIPDQLRSVMRYYLDMYSDPSTNNNNSTEDVFEKIASTLARANTYGVDIVTCHDVRPFILSAREVDEGTLPTFLLILVFIFVALKVLLFCVVRFRAG